MNLEIALEHRAQVEQFRHKYRTGLVTLLFTDMVGSIKLKQALGDRDAVALMHHHHAMVREILSQFPDGQEISTTGDSFFLVFVRPSDAVWFALLLQSRLRGFNQGSSHPLLDRIGIHIGEVVIEEREGALKPRDLYGMQVDSCARVMSLAGGNQILLTRSAFDNARQALKGEERAGLGTLSWLNHGTYQLSGVEEPVEICEVGEASLATLQQPADSEKARRAVAAGEEAVLGWRPASSQLVPNTRWVLEQKLGEGGFGEVWLGRHQTMKERRVFKFCFQADRVRSLKREMTLFRILKERVGDHPNIVRLLEVNFDKPPFYVVMDYVEGQDLKAWCEQQGGVEKIPLTARLEIVAQIAEALQAAHDAGVIHRDVKPGNILVHRSSRRQEALTSSAASSETNEPPDVGCYDVHAKLTDFGIGQVVSEAALAGMTKVGFTQTIVAESSSSQSGSQMYMAPELLAGKTASTRSDIYSLGVVLFQVLVGDFTRPITTDWQQDVPDPLLRDDLKHCFAGHPQDRFAGAGQLAENVRALPKRRVALEQQAAELAARERAAYRRGIVLTASLAAVIVALVTGLAIAALHQSRKAKATALRESHEKAEARRFLYVANLNLAQQAWEQNNIDRLRQLLEETQDSPDRGFEWYYWQRQTHLALKTLRGHLGPVTSVAFSPDGRRIVTGSGDQTAKVWEVVSGKVMLALKGHSDRVLSAAFSPDGQRIVTGSHDQTAKVWEAASGRALRTLQGHRSPVRSVAFSPDSQWIVTGSDDQMAKVWEAASGRVLRTLQGHSDQIVSVAFSPDGQRIVTGSWDQTAKVWEAASGRELLTLKGHSAEVWAVAFSPDSQRIVTGSDDRTAKVWEAASGRELLTLEGHNNWIRSAAFSPDGRRIVTSSWDQTAKLWEAASGRELVTLKGHANWIGSVAFSPDGQWIVTGSLDQTAKVWEVATGRGLLTLQRHRDQVLSAAFSSDGQWIVTGSLDQTAKVWEAASGRELLTLNGHTGWVRSAAFSPDSQRIVTGSLDQTAKVWETVSGGELVTLQGHTSWIGSVAFSPDGRRIVTGSGDQTAKVWEAASGRELFTLQGHSAPLRSVAFSPDGQRIVTGSGDQTAKVWEAVHGKELLTLRGHSDGINSVAFSPDGQRIITGSEDQTVKVWETANGRELRTLLGHSAPIGSVAFSPDGQRIVTGSEDRTAKVWEAISGRELLTLKRHSAPIGSVAFSPDGQRIVTGSEDRTAKVWLATRAEQVAAWQVEERAVAQDLAALQRERADEQERQRIARARDEGAIKRWLILTPIAFAAGQSGTGALDTEQIVGEGRLQPKAGGRAVTGSGELTWQEVAPGDYAIDFNVILGHVTTRSVAYAVCYIRSEIEQRGLEMLVGSSDQAKVYLNEKQIHRYPIPRSFLEDQDRVPDISLKAGLNVLVFKVVNEGGYWKGSIRFTDAQGNPVKGIQVTLTP